MNRNDLAGLFQNITGHGVELGVYKGEYSREILSRYSGVLHLVDPWEGDFVGLEPQKWSSVYSKCLDNLEVFKDRYVIHRKLSIDAVNDFEDRSLDFVYIDADHQYEHVCQDISIWYPKLRVGGIMSGHDFLADGFIEDIEQGVNRAVWLYCGIFGVKVHLTNENKWKSWWFEK